MKLVIVLEVTYHLLPCPIPSPTFPTKRLHLILHHFLCETRQVVTKGVDTSSRAVTVSQGACCFEDQILEFGYQLGRFWSRFFSISKFVSFSGVDPPNKFINTHHMILLLCKSMCWFIHLPFQFSPRKGFLSKPWSQPIIPSVTLLPF